MKKSCMTIGYQGRFLAAGAVLALLLGFSGQGCAENIKLTCKDSSYPSFVSCTVSPNAVTRKVNEQVTKGHLVAGYECMQSQNSCVNYMIVPPKLATHSCGYDDYACLCNAVKPDCKGGWSR